MELIAPQLYTADEYLALEEKSMERHEFVNGEIIPMAGETPDANEIASNLLVFFKLLLKGKPFKTYDHDVKLMIGTKKIFRYPDMMVVKQEGVDKKWVTHPVLIVEVLSESTEKIDREKKRVEYCSLATMQYYLLVHQDEPCVEVFRRNGKKWEFEFYTSLTDFIELPFFETKVTLEEIYEGITFDHNSTTHETPTRS
ncbi:MAG: Uma2 family endonuclease [Spirosomataceae bacterium]